jgi:hypothetical protein
MRRKLQVHTIMTSSLLVNNLLIYTQKKKNWIETPPPPSTAVSWWGQIPPVQLREAACPHLSTMGNKQLNSFPHNPADTTLPFLTPCTVSPANSLRADFSGQTLTLSNDYHLPSLRWEEGEGQHPVYLTDVQYTCSLRPRTMPWKLV